MSSVTFKDWVGFKNLLLNPWMFSADGCQVLQNQLCAFCLSGTTLTTAVTKQTDHNHVTAGGDMSLHHNFALTMSYPYKIKCHETLLEQVSWKLISFLDHHFYDFCPSAIKCASYHSLAYIKLLQFLLTFTFRILFPVLSI